MKKWRKTRVDFHFMCSTCWRCTAHSLLFTHIKNMVKAYLHLYIWSKLRFKSTTLTSTFKTKETHLLTCVHKQTLKNRSWLYTEIFHKKNMYFCKETYCISSVVYQREREREICLKWTRWVCLSSHPMSYLNQEGCGWTSNFTKTNFLKACVYTRQK